MNGVFTRYIAYFTDFTYFSDEEDSYARIGFKFLEECFRL